ncbi:MAG: YaiI/YqxD family protein [Vulcanimicrobiota bacterium]
MRVLVDADSCPVREIVVRVAKARGIPVLMCIDTCHVIDDGYSEVVTVDKGRDSVDIALINRTQAGDIVITGDYGVAALALSKGAVPVSPHGHIFDSTNIDRHLFERHLFAKVRRGGGRGINPKARKKEDDRRFEDTLIKIVTDSNINKTVT